METSTPSFGWIKVLAMRLLFWLPSLVFRKWIYPDSELWRHSQMFPRSDGVRVYNANGNHRAELHLLVANLSPYLDLNLEPLALTINGAIDCASKSYVVNRSSIETVTLRATLNEAQRDMLRKVCETGIGATINCQAVFSSAGRRIEKGFTLEDVRVRYLA